MSNLEGTMSLEHEANDVRSGFETRLYIPQPVEIPYQSPGDSPVLFLDVDGVLIGWTDEEFTSVMYGSKFIDKTVFTASAVQQVNRILTETGAKIVISSAWRFNVDLMTSLLQSDVKFGPWVNGNLIGTTGRERVTRGAEIHEWLMRYGYPKKFVALDDDERGMDLLEGAFIQTKWEVGVTKRIADRVISKLNGGRSDCS